MPSIFYLVFTLLYISSYSLNAKTLEFEEAYQAVLDHAFEINAAIAKCNAKEGERLQAGMYPNPELNIGLDTFGPTNHNDENELFVGVTQLLELGGKRSARERVANAQLCSTNWDIEILKNQLYVDLLHAFIDVAIAQERVEFARLLQIVSDQTRQCVSVKVETGTSCALEAKKAEVASQTAQLFLAKQLAELSKANKRLRSMWDCHAPKFEGVFYPLYTLTPPPPLKELNATLASHPILAKAEAEQIKALEMVRLERSNSIPDVSLTLGVTTERYTRDPSLSFEIDIPIPLFDRNRGNIHRATYEHCQAVYNQLKAECQLEKDLSIVYEEWSLAYEQAHTLRTVILPSAIEVDQLAQATYQEGKFNYLDFLDARSTLFSVKQQYLDAIEAYHHKRVEALKLTAQKYL